MHVDKVSRNIGEHGRLQILVETFTGQASTYFVEIFGGKKLTKQA